MCLQINWPGEIEGTTGPTGLFNCDDIQKDKNISP